MMTASEAIARLTSFSVIAPTPRPMIRSWTSSSLTSIFSSASSVEVGFDRHTLSVLVRVGPQVQRRIRGQQDRLEQRVDAELLLGRHVDEHRLAAVLLGDQVVLGELLADLRRVGALLVDLV